MYKIRITWVSVEIVAIYSALPRNLGRYIYIYMSGTCPVSVCSMYFFMCLNTLQIFSHVWTCCNVVFVMCCCYIYVDTLETLRLKMQWEQHNTTLKVLVLKEK